MRACTRPPAAAAARGAAACGRTCVRRSTVRCEGHTQDITPADTDGINKYSARVTQPKSQGASQAMLYATGLQEADMNKAQVGISSCWYEGALDSRGCVRARARACT